MLNTILTIIAIFIGVLLFTNAMFASVILMQNATGLEVCVYHEGENIGRYKRGNVHTKDMGTKQQVAIMNSFGWDKEIYQGEDTYIDMNCNGEGF